MSEIQVQINNKEIVTRKTITSMRVSVQSLELNQGCILRVLLLTDDGDVVDIHHLDMRGDDYKLWGIDDNYCVRYAAQKLGVSLKIV